MRATSLVIAHRLSTIADADELMMLDAGEYVEYGTHDELLRNNDLYANVWQRQHHTDDSGQFTKSKNA